MGVPGSGKSTIGKILSGLLKPNNGYVKINNIKIEKKTIQRIRPYIGVVFQNPDNQFVGNTVENDIAFGLENIRIPRKKMKSIIKIISKLDQKILKF